MEIAKQQVVAYTQKSQIKHENRHIQLVREYGFHPRNKATVEDGDVLPKKFEPFPENMYGRPLEEIDQFIYEETFCVVSKRFRKNYIHRFTGTKSLFLFYPWSVARRICVYIATNQYFDYCVMATILFNCIFLAMTETVEEAEYIFLAIYTIEMVIKIIAKGFLLNKYTYLRNPWNWLDFVVIASGYATIGMDVGNLAGLRTFRVLRALKTVSIMPGLKTIINALLHSFRQLAEVMTLTIFCLMVFALFALQVYMGELRNKCVKNVPDEWSNTSDLEWRLWINDTDNWLYDDEELPMLCGNLTGARHCPFGYTCLCVGENPNHGYTNFDNFMWSMLTTFQLITLDYWENVYNMVLATSGPMSVSFFTVVVFFGSFYLINLMLAVVALSYEEEAEITNEERKKDLLDHRDDSTFSFDPSVLNVKKLNKSNKKKIDSRKGVLLASYSKKKTRRKKPSKGTGKEGGNNTDSNGNGTHHSKNDSLTPTPSPSPRHSSCERPTDLALKCEHSNEQTSHKENQQQQQQQHIRQSRICFQDDAPKDPNMLYPANPLMPSRQASSNSSGVNRESSQDDSGVVDDHDEQDVTASEVVNVSATDTQNDHTAVTLALSPREVRLIKCNGNIARIKKHNIYALHPEYSSEIVVIDDLPDRNCDRCVQCCIDYEGWLQFQNCLYKVVRDPLFELAITLCIVLNTAFLAMEHHGMSESFRNALDVGNKVFTSIFTFECIIKLMALSKDFFLCGWNIFDLIIVTASLLDIIFELVDGLSVLRGLRLLRVLKLAQSWTTMKVLLSIIISTIGALGNLTLILVIVIYIFAVIGMQLFSKDYTPDKFEPDPVPRWNFNDFFHSFMMIFRILCGEWIEPLWDCMRAEEEQGASSCFAIFLPTLVMGNFMVLNLFLALLLNSFNSEELKSKKEEVGEESKLARSIERVRDLIRKKREERKERKERKYATKFQQIVIEAQQAAATTIDKPSLMTETKFHRLSYQESMNRPVSGSDFGYQIPLKGSLHTIADGVETEDDKKSYSSQQLSHSLLSGVGGGFPHQHQHQQPALQLLYQQQQPAMPSFDGTVASSCQLDNNSLNPQLDRRLQHQMSSGFGTQPNDSRDEPTTYTESIELQLMGQYNSTDTDPYANDQRSGSYIRADSLQERSGSYMRADSLLERSSTRHCSEEHDESYLQYQKSLLTRSPSYRKSLDRLSQSSDQSQRSLIPSRSLKSDEDGHSRHSLNTISIEHEELLSNQANLRDELLNCDQKELFQFLQDDLLDNSNNYFSDTVGYGSALMEADTDSLIVTDGRREERKPSTSSIKSNLSYISNSILQTIESRRNGSHSSNGNGHDCDNLPLVEHSEFDNIIQSFEKELEEIKKSTTSLERKLSTLSEPSPAADEANKAILEHIAVITGASERTAADEVVAPLNPYDSYDLSSVPRRQLSLPASTSRATAKIKRRSLEKQRKIDEDFSITNEIRKICDQMQAPFVTVEAMSVAATQASGAQSPFMRRKSDLFSAQFDRFKRMSLIERVEEVPEEEKPISTLRMESERLPRKCLTAESMKIDSLSLKSTNSYENLLLHKQLTEAQNQQKQQQHQLQQKQPSLQRDSSHSSSAAVPPTPPTSLKSTIEPHSLVQLSSLKATPPLTALTEHQQHYHATTAQTRTTPFLPRAGQHSVEAQQNKLHVKRSKHPQSSLDKAASFQSGRTESHSSGAAETSSILALTAPGEAQLLAAGGDSITQRDGEALQSQKSTFSRLTEKPWHCLVSYVDDLTVGGRRNSQGAYNDPMTFPSFGQTKPPKVPDDCFPQKCYEHFYFRCPWFMSCMDTKSAKHWTRVRTAVLTVVDTPAFEWFVLVLIFASSITLCFEDIYLDSNKSLKRILYWTNFSFCLIFVIEMVLKWLALGFSKYFTSFWTILDFIIVFVSVFSLLIEENENLKVLRSLRTLRALRPLRAISRWQGMRIVVNALMYAIPSIFNVLLVCLVFWLIFSIMGVQFFGGKFFKCIDNDGELLPVTEVNDKWDCIEQNFSWINSKITFDHVGMGYLALLQVATFEGWMEVMADAVDARGVDLQPQREANLYAYIYFVIFIVCGSFFTLNLFIGVIIDNFNMLKKKYEGGVLEMFLTESQKHYYTAMKKLGRKKPQKVIKRPINHFLAMFYDLSNSRRFEIAIFVLIFLNMLTMGIEHYNQPHAVFFILEVSNAFFTTVFGLEAIVKIIGLRYHYFTVPWNVFDFLLVLASIFGILMEDIMIDLPISPTLLRVVRVFRIGRILRLIKAAKGIRKLLFALVVSLPALFNIGALLGLITFIYAILGMSLFGHVKLQGALDDMVNFQTFGRSMQLLFRLMTSAGWNDVLESLMIQPPDCDPNFNRQTNGDCGHPLLAISYFTSFIIISYMIVINMYIAIILENFNQAHQEEEIGIVEDDLEMFYIRWSKYDPHATQFIHFAQLSDFIASLDPPLGIAKPNTVALVSFNLPISKGNKIHCLDILHALVKHVLGHVEETDNFKQLQEQMDVKFKKQFPTRKELEIVSSTRIWKRQEKAAKLIQTTWREYQRRKKEKERSNSGDSATQTSSPGGWQARLSSLNFFHLQVSRRGTQCSSRASSRKSSRASDASDISELAGPWLNLPLMMVSGADDVVNNIKQQSEEMGKRPICRISSCLSLTYESLLSEMVNNILTNGSQPNDLNFLENFNECKRDVNTNCDISESKYDHETEEEYKEGGPLTVAPIISEDTEKDDSEAVVLSDYIDIGDLSNTHQSEELEEVSSEEELSTEGSGSDADSNETTTLSPRKEDSTEPDLGSETVTEGSTITDGTTETVSEEPTSTSPNKENSTEPDEDDNETEEMRTGTTTTDGTEDITDKPDVSTEVPEKVTEETSTDDSTTETPTSSTNDNHVEPSSPTAVSATEEPSSTTKPESCENLIEGDERNDKPLPKDTSQKQTKTCPPKLTTSSTDTDSDVTITMHNLEVSRGSRSTIHEQNLQTITTVSPITPTTQKTTLVSDSPETTTLSSPEETTTDQTIRVKTTTPAIPQSTSTTLKPPIDGTTYNPTDYTIDEDFSIFDSEFEIDDFQTTTKTPRNNFEEEELLPLTPQQTDSSKGPNVGQKPTNEKSVTVRQADFADEEFLPVDSKLPVQDVILDHTTDINYITDPFEEDFYTDFSTTTIADKEATTPATTKEIETTETVKSETKEDEKPTTSIKRREISEVKTTELDASTPSSDETEEGSGNFFEDFIRVPIEEVSTYETTPDYTTANPIENSTSKQQSSNTPSTTLTPTQTPTTTPKNIQSEPCEKHSDTLVIHVREEEHEQPTQDTSYSSKSLYYILRTKPVINNNTTTNINMNNNDTKSCNGTVAASPCIQPNDGRMPILEITAEQPIEVRLSVCPPKCRNDHKHNYLSTSNRAVSLRWFPNKSNQTLGFETANEVKIDDKDC